MGTDRRLSKIEAPALTRNPGPNVRSGLEGEPGVEARRTSYYSYYMKGIELKVARIGNSRGVRIPAVTLERYRIGDSVVMEERTEGILLRPRRSARPKLSWEDTALAMSAEQEDWSDWDTAFTDGLDELPWEPAKAKRAAEPKRRYPAVPKRASRKK